jgi:SAM-dependent methyltransferase
MADQPAAADRHRTPTLDDFLVEPTRDLEDWRWLWAGDHTFPIRSHRGLAGKLLVGLKRLLRPLIRLPLNDLWERQRTFNLILIERLARMQEVEYDVRRRLDYLEALNAEGVRELMAHNDALFARADQKLDRYRREARDLLGSLGAALATLKDAGPSPEAVEAVERAHEEHGYFELERRYRGTEEEIRERIAAYLPFLAKIPAGRPVLDLGCGRGEALALLRDHDIPGRGVDGNARMVAQCRARDLDVEEGDLFAVLAAASEGSLGGVTSFHVIEHLPLPALDRLVHLAYRALAPGGVLILETPNPLSLVVAARNFWLDPTHLRPVHPESLRLAFELAGFEPVQRLDLRPFLPADRLPEIDLATIAPEQRDLADRVNRLRDRLDDLIFGYQDYGLIGTKP